MSDDFAGFLANRRQQEAPAPEGDLTGFLSTRRLQQTQEVQSQLQLGIEQALKENPDVVAERQRLSRTSGLPFAVVSRNLDELRVKEQARSIEMLRLAQNSPILARQLFDPTLLGQTHDHLDNLSSIERTFGGTLRDVGVTALKGAVGLPQAFVGLADIPTFGYAGKVLESAGVRFNEAQKILDRSYSPAQQRANAAVQEADGFVETLGTMLQNPSTLATTIGQSIPQMLGGAALGRAILASAPKIAPWLAAALGEGVLAGGSAAEQIRADTADGLLTLKQSSAAVLSGAGTALFGAAGGKLAQKLRIADIDTVLVNQGADAVTAKALKDGFVRTIVKAGISEGVFEEMPQSVQEQLWQNWATDKPLGQGVGKAAAMGLLAGATTGAAVQGARRALQRQAEVTGAEDSANNLKAQFDLAAQALLRERNPDEFRTLVQTMADNTEGAPKEIYVDAEVLNQLAPEVLNQLPQSVRDALPDALAANDVVAISTGDVLAIAPGTPLEQVLIENARIGDPMAMSQKEAKDAGSKAQEFLAQEAQRVIQQASDQQAMQASSDRVKQGVLDQLNSVGRFRKEVNEGYATWTAAFYTTMAGRTGMTPEQMAAKYPLRITGQSGQGETLKAGKVGEIAVEGFNFGKSNRTTLSGSNFGRGLAGNNRDLYLNAADKRLSKRIYFYVDKGTGITPEAGVGGIARKFNLTNVYDGDTDPLRLKTGRDQLGFESAVLDAGFSGYLTRMEGTQSGQVILLGDQTVTGELLGPTTRTTGKVVPEKGAREARGRDVIVDALNADKTLPSGSPTLARWQELLAKNPEVLQALTDAGVFAGDQTATAFKSELIKAYQDATPAESYAQSDKVRTGRTLFTSIIDAMGLSKEEVDSTAIEFMTGLPGNMAFLPPAVGGIPDVVSFLDERRKASGLPTLDIKKPEDRAQLARLVAAEALAHIRNAGDSLEWYDQTINATVAQMAVKYPELNTDPYARTAFLLATAIASQGMNPETNLSFSSEQYAAFRETGKFPETGKGESASAMADNYKKANALLEEMGPELFGRFLVTPFTVKELATAGFEVGGESMPELVLGSSVFGPKIGFGFFSNLNGNFEPVTMDMWFMRTIGRLTGTLPAYNPAKFANQLQRLRDGLKVRGRASDGVFASQFDRDLVQRAKKDQDAAVELARKVKKAHEKDYKAHRAEYDSGKRAKSEMVLAADTIIQSMDKPRDVPASGGERQLLRDVTRQVVELVTQHYGQRVPPAALQALIWYPEQELYAAMGVKLAVTSQDYSGAARKLLKAEGFNEQDLNNAVSAATQPGSGRVRSADGAADTGAVRGDGQGTRGTGALQADERTQFLIKRNARLTAERQAAATRVNFEVAPDPNDAALTDRWRQLPQDVRLAISNRLVQRVLPGVLKSLKAAGDLLPQVGSYLDDTNPSFALRLTKGDPARVSKALGFILSQDSMMAIGSEAFADSFEAKALRVAVGEKTTEEIDALYQTLRAIQVDGRQVIGGQSTSGGVMTILLDSQDSAEVVGPLVDAALGGEYDVTGHDVHAAFPEKKDYDYGLPESDPAGDEGLDRQRARDARTEAAGYLREELDTLDSENLLKQDGAPGEVLNQGVSQTDTPEFKAWFGDSKVVDESGRPLVVYHGTARTGITQFTGHLGVAGHFAFDPKKAEGYADDRYTTAQDNGTDVEYGDGAVIYPVYLSAKKIFDARNPSHAKIIGESVEDAQDYDVLEQNIDAIKAAGFDAYYDFDGRRGEPDGIAVFSPTQIKSAIGNQGAFDPTDPNILKQGPRGTFSPKNLELALNENADLSTFLHETGHFFLEVMADLASQPGAPADIATDMAALMKWFGVADLATWNALPLDGKRPYHERFAESFEQYLLEGKAPSVELQPLFRKFRAWMLNVYKSLKAFVDGRTGETQIQLSPEIRQVFDRMLASEAQIAEANEVAGLLPNEEADAEANERLTARSLRDLKWTVNARAREIKKLQAQAKEQRKEVEAEVTAEVNQMPEFAAKAVLDQLRKDSKAQPSEADLAVVADSFGYPDADTMLQAIDAVGKKADVIEGMTDQRMLEQYGDLIDQRAIEAAANEAVHNEARARSLATELRSQAEMLNPRTDTGQVNAQGSRITVNALVEAAKQFAANVISRTPLRDLKAKAWQHTAAERRAGKRWAEATAKGETQEAVKAKQDQMLNNAAAKAAIDAQAEMRKMLEFFRRVIKDNNEKVVEKGRDPDVVNAARAVLAAYGVAPKAGKTALEYLALVEKNDPAMYAALQPSVQGALNLAQPLDALTMDELRGLHEEIQAMWHLAKRSRQMEVDGNLLDIEDAETELQDRMQEIGVPDTMPGDTGAVTPREELARKLQYAGSILRRVEQWAQGMGSAFTKLVFQPVKEAADRYRADRVVYRKRYQALVDAVAPVLTKGLIAAPELDYTFGKGHNGIGHAELLHAILHTGNASNKRKLLLGRNWATENADGTLNTDRWDAFLQRMHDTGVLTKAHYDFAQGVWDLLEQTKPLAQKTHRDVFGRYFAEVTADSFDTPFGSYAGGYVPAQADPRIVQDADLRALATLENENMSFSFPGTNKGFTKGRVEYNRPLMLDLRTIGQHLDKVLLFSHMEPAVRDVNKLLSRKGVSYSLGRIDPTVYAGMLTPWLKRSATQVVETPEVADGGISRMMSAARSRAGMALMFANLSNTLQQITGFSVAAIKVKPASMMRATATFIAAPKQTAKAVADASTFMANRMENEIAAINDAMDAILLDPSLYEKSQAWTQKHAYFLQTAMANTVEPIIWTAAYNDAITRGDSDRDAVRHADSVIRTTQGSTLPEDVSRLETGRAWARLFTQFIGYFNMLANTNATALLQVSREMGLKKGAGKALGIVTLGMLAPIWVAEAIAHAMRGGPEDEDKDGYLDDWLMAVFGMGTIKGTFAMVPFLGQAAQLTVNKFNDNPADDKFSLSPAVSLIESTVSAPFSVYKAIAEDGNRQKAVRDVASAVSVVTGLPAFAVARPLGYLAAVEQGKVEPTDALDLARGLVSGTASPASK